MRDREDVMRRGFAEFGQYVNPLIHERVRLATEPYRLVQARDGALVDDEGRVYEDFHGTQAFGHRNPAVAAAIVEYLQSDVPSWYPSRLNPLSGRLARRLAERTGYDSVSFAFSGSDGVEAAFKLARAATGRPRVLGLERAYHGCGMGSTALMHPGPFRDPFGPHVPGVAALPMNDVPALERALADGDVAAVIVEPIQGEGGVRPLSSEYVAALCALTEQHGTLLVADEVQTGMGRSGRLLLSAGWPRRPDAAVLAKQLGGGLVPLSTMLTRRALWERAYGRDVEDGEAHNATLSSNGIGAVAGLAALELLTEELLERIRSVGAEFKRELAERLAGSPLFREVRGEGLLLGIELAPIEHPWLSLEAFGMSPLAEKGRSSIAPLLCHRLYGRGFYCFAAGHDWTVVRLQPRFAIDPATLSRFAVAFREELDYLESLS